MKPGHVTVLITLLVLGSVAGCTSKSQQNDQQTTPAPATQQAPAPATQSAPTPTTQQAPQHTTHRAATNADQQLPPPL
ncbi:MAG: hypothetical protein WBR15_02360 [Gammaproteobacteria bacterium]